MAKGGASIFLSLLALLIAGFIASAVIRAAVVVATSGRVQKFWEFLWMIFLQLIDAGNLANENENSVWLKLVGTLTILLGVVIFSMLIAFISAQLEKFIYDFRKGRSAVIENGHSLILGWNERVYDIIRGLVIANESRKDACVVILAPDDKEEMDDRIAANIADTKTTRIVTRGGDPASPNELRRVNAAGARSAIILAPCPENAGAEEKKRADAHSVKTVMAVLSAGDNENPIPIVVEIINEKNREMIAYLDSKNIITINSGYILGRLMAQTSITSGTGMVYNELLSFVGSEMYFHKAAWDGDKFSNLKFRFHDGVPLGIRKPDASLILRPPKDAVLNEDDEILILAQDDSAIRLVKSPVAAARDLPLPEKKLEREKQRVLILGWHEIGAVIVEQYADYLHEGSEIDIVAADPSESFLQTVDELKRACPSLRITSKQGDAFDYGSLKNLKPLKYDKVIILSQSEDEIPTDSIDSETIIILLLLRRMSREASATGRQCRIITQILKSENQELITQTDIDDFIVSNRLITMMLSQLSENPKIEAVYNDLFSEQGSEIYSKTAGLYFDNFPADVTFADLMALAEKREEICLGVRLGNLSLNADKNFGIILNPPKTKSFTLTDKDFLVVLSDDEL